MKRLMLATVAVAALTLPAMAQSQKQPPQNPPPQAQSQQMQQQKAQKNQQQAQQEKQQAQQEKQQAQQNEQQAQQQEPGQQQAANEVIRPQSLNKHQIMELQQALNKKGFDAGNVDGVWGSDTAKAVREFKKMNKMQANDRLDHQTLQQLGLNFQQGQQGTVGQAPEQQPGMGQGQTNEMSQPPQNTQPPEQNAQPPQNETQPSGQSK